MAEMLWIWPALTLSALALLLLAESRQSHAGKWLFKPIASLGFIMTALACGALDSVYGIIILVGLVLSMAGDVLLIPRRRLAFLTGLVAFLLGHAAYVVAFVVHGFMPLAVIFASLALVGFGLILALRYLRRIDAGMHGPVVAYGIVITAMLALAVGATAAGGSWLIVTGAALFYLSDLSVARDRLIEASFLQRAWGLPAYFIGQLMLAGSVM